MKKTKKTKLLIEIIFWLHLPIVILWFGLFIVPKSIFPFRVIFHFWYIAGIMLIQLIWSLIIFRKLDIICPLTTWMQSLRGFPLKDKNNFNHSFIAELLQRLKLDVDSKFVSILLIITLIIVSIQYFFLQ